MNKEIISFNSGEMTPKTDALSNIEKYASGCRHLENFLPRIYGSAERRPGTTFSKLGLEHDIYYKPLVCKCNNRRQRHYAFTYFGDNGSIWGVPLNPLKGTTLCLDAGGVARNVGGGIVGLPCAGHPFKAGQTIIINGTTYYDNSGIASTVLSGTTANEIQITDTYGAETFDGTETVIAILSGLVAGLGNIDRDADWNLYLATNSPYYCTKISPDFLTVTTNWLTPSAGNWPLSSTATGLKISNDGKYLYLLFGGAGGNGNLYKFRLSDGSEKWMVDIGYAELTYDIVIDADDNVYCPASATGDKGFKSVAIISSDGSTITSTTVAHGGTIWVDDSMGIVLTGNEDWWQTTQTYYWGWNLYKLNIGETVGTGVRLGGLTYLGNVYGFPTWRTDRIRYGNIITYNGYIYVLMWNTFDEVNPKVATPKWQIFKLDSDLNIIAQVDAPTYSLGIYADGVGHIVIIRQNAPSDRQEDVFWYYDTDLNYVTKTDHLYDHLFSGWDVFDIIKGNELLPDTNWVMKY